MKEFPEYPSVDNLYRVTDILNLECVVQEKIHGTNGRIAYLKDHGLVIGGRTKIIYLDGNKNGELYGFTDWCLENHIGEKLALNPEYYDYVFYGEFYGSNIQKGVRYSDTKTFRVFDIRNPSGEMLDWVDVERICKQVGFPTVPVIRIGKVDLAFLEGIRDNTTLVGQENGFTDPNNIWEGVVLKPLRMQRDRHGGWIIAKYKSDKWAESVKAPKVRSIDQDKIDLDNRAREFAQSVVTMGRVATVIDHITRDGNQEISMKRTPDFLREMVHDVTKEYEEFYLTLSDKEKTIYNKAISGMASSLWKKEVETRAFSKLKPHESQQTTL